MELVMLVYKLSDQLPKDERYGLRTQMNNAVMLNFSSKEITASVLAVIDEEQKMLQSFIAKVGSS